MVKAEDKIEATDEAWDSGELGCDEVFARVSKDVKQSQVNAAVGLKPISIRMQESMVEDLKVISQINGFSGYQPLMRHILHRFIEGEKRMIMNDLVDERARKEQEEAKSEDLSDIA